MGCKSCPYIIDEFDDWAEMLPICDDEDIVRICSCDKLGQVIDDTTCGEDDITMSKKNRRKPRKFNRYERKMRYKKKLARLADETWHGCSGARRIGYDGSSFYWDGLHVYKLDNSNTKYVKKTYLPHYAGWLKKMSNRRIRRYRGELPSSGRGYQKLYDYWGELW